MTIAKPSGAIESSNQGCDYVGSTTTDVYMNLHVRAVLQAEKWRDAAQGSYGMKPKFGYDLVFAVGAANMQITTIASNVDTVVEYTDADSGWNERDVLVQYVNGAKLSTIDYGYGTALVKTAAIKQKFFTQVGEVLTNDVYAISYATEYDDDSFDAPAFEIMPRQAQSPVLGDWVPYAEGESCSAYELKMLAENTNCINYKTRIKTSAMVP